VGIPAGIALPLWLDGCSFFTGATQPQAFCPKSLDERKLEIPTTTNNTLELHTSFEATPGACLQSSRYPYLNCPTAAAHLYSFRTSMPPPRHHTRSTPPELQISIPLHLHVHTPTAYLHSSEPLCTPPRPYTCSTPPELRIYIPLHLHVYAPGAHLQCFIPLHLHIYAPAAHLQKSYLYASYTSLHPQHASRSLEANTSTSTRRHQTSRAPELHTSTPPRPRTAACLQNSRAAYLSASMSLRLHRTSRPPRPRPAARRERSSHEFFDEAKIQGEGAYRTFRSSRQIL